MMACIEPNDTDNVSISSLSFLSLPPELFHRIFDYCDVKTLLVSVRSTCKLLHALIHTYRRWPLIINLESEHIFEPYAHLILPENVISLIVENRFGGKDRINLLYSLINFSQFCRIHSLSLQQIPYEDVKLILESITTNCLSSLYIRTTKSDDSLIWGLVKSSVTRWTLKKLCIPYTNFMKECDIWSNQHQIRHLQFAYCNYTDYLLILHQLPNLRELVIENCLIYDKLINEGPFASNTYTSSLVSLAISHCSCTPEHFELLISPLPLLEHLSIRSHRAAFDSMFHESYWKELICNKLPKLRQCEFFLAYTGFRINQFFDLKSLVEPFRTSFWINDRRMFVASAYVPQNKAVCLYTTPIDNTDYQKSLRCEVSWMDNIYRLTERPLNMPVEDTLREKLVEVNVANCVFGSAGAQYVSMALENNQTVTVLEIGTNQIKASGMLYLAKALQNNTTITKLDLSINRLAPNGAQSLGNFLQHNNIVTTLILYQNRLVDTGTKYIADALLHNNTLTTLDIGSNRIGDMGVQHLGRVLSDNKTLAVLFLENNLISEKGAESIAQALLTNTTLIKLNLERNQIGDVGTQHLANALSTNETLTGLTLTSNAIGSSGIQFLANSLQYNSTLLSLNISYNDIEQHGVQCLAEALKINSTLTELDLTNVGMSGTSVQYLANALLINKTLKILDLKDNRTGSQGAFHIAKSLQNNTSLTTLNISVNQIGDEGAQYFGEALYQNTTLVTLDLQWNQIEDLGAKYLFDALKVNTTLRDLIFIYGNNISMTIYDECIAQRPKSDVLELIRFFDA